jgi:hypothetical protein
MAFARLHDLAMRLAQEVVAISEDFVDRTWLLEDARIGRDPSNSAWGERRHSELRIPRNDPVEPRSANSVLSAILAEGVDQCIDVSQDHLSRPA